MSFSKTNKQLPIFSRAALCFALGVTLMVGRLDSALAEVKQTKHHELLNQGCSFSGSFEEETKASSSTEAMISSGSIFFDCTYGVIFKTESEIASTQILTLENINFSLDQDSNIELSKGVAESLQAKLILSVLRGDHAFINKHFEVHEDATSTLKFTPISKTYKRGLDSLALTKSGNDQEVVAIKILDRRGRETNMKIIQNRVYATTENALAACRELYSESDYCNILTSPEQYKTHGS